MSRIIIFILFFGIFLGQYSTAHSVPPLRGGLKSMDLNNNDIVEPGELNRPKIQNFLTRRFIRKFSNFDCNEDRALDIAEITIYGIDSCRTKTRSELQALRDNNSKFSGDVKSFDLNNNGFIELDENEINKNFVLWLTQNLWEKADCNKDGGIDRIELMNMGLGGCSHEKLAESVSSGEETKPYHTFMITPAGSGPFPVIIYSHGAGGLGAEESKNWARRWFKLGFSVILVDHFVLRDHDYSDPLKMAKILRTEVEWRKNDLVSILKDVRKNKVLDSSRVTLIGQSRGGYLVLEGLLNKSIHNNAILNHPIKSAIMFYPSQSICFPGFFEFKPVTKPLMILFGNKDIFLPMCWKNLAPKLRSPGHPQVIKIYEGANHLFDVYSTRRKCKSFSVPASIINSYSELKIGQTFETCNEYNERAHKNSIRDVKEFLNSNSK